MERFLFWIQNNTLPHHAFTIDSKLSEKEFLDLLDEIRDGEVASTVELFSKSYTSFGVDDAREIINISNNIARKDTQIVCLFCDSLSPESQNALLKQFEEPVSNTVFAVFTDTTQLLETLLSRTYSIHDSNFVVSEVALNFLRMSVVDKLKQVAKMVDNHKKGVFTRNQIDQFIEEIEIALYNEMTEDALFIVEKIENARSFLKNPGASVKIVLEYLAVITPSNPRESAKIAVE